MFVKHGCPRRQQSQNDNMAKISKSGLAAYQLFADDSKLYATNNSETPIQNDIDQVVKWTKDWLMTLNSQKCKHMHIGKGDQNNINLLLKDLGEQDIEIAQVNEEKDLGVTFDKSMTFSTHIQISINKANKILGLIFRTYT